MPGKPREWFRDLRKKMGIRRFLHLRRPKIDTIEILVYPYFDGKRDEGRAVTWLKSNIGILKDPSKLFVVISESAESQAMWEKSLPAEIASHTRTILVTNPADVIKKLEERGLRLSNKLKIIAFGQHYGMCTTMARFMPEYLKLKDTEVEYDLARSSVFPQTGPILVLEANRELYAAFRNAGTLDALMAKLHPLLNRSLIKPEEIVEISKSSKSPEDFFKEIDTLIEGRKPEKPPYFPD